MRPRLVVRVVVASLALAGGGAGCSSGSASPPRDGGADASAARPWYDTELDRDTSYLPMGPVAHDTLPFAWSGESGTSLQADAYLPAGAAAPVVVFLPGAAVVKERYYWFGSLLASHGV